MPFGAGQIVYEDDFPPPRYCQLRQLTTGQTFASSTTASVLNFGAGTEDFDTDNWHDVTTNPSRVTPNVPGVYRARAKVVWSFSTTITACTVNILKNGSIVESSGNTKPNSTNNVATNGGQVELLVYMNGTSDYLEAAAAQTSTGAANQTTNVATSGYTTFFVELIDPE